MAEAIDDDNDPRVETIGGDGELLPGVQVVSKSDHRLDYPDSLNSLVSSDSEATNSLNLHLQTQGLALQLQTRASLSPQLVALTTRLEFALDKLKETEDRLNTAIYKVGYLEAQLEQKNKEVSLLAEQRQTTARRGQTAHAIDRVMPQSD